MGVTAITETFLRVHLQSIDLLKVIADHPTLWARFRLGNSGRHHQRAYTIINPQRASGAFDVDVHLHDSATTRWAESTVTGGTIIATVQNTGFAPPRANATHMHLIGDAASIPAMRSILDTIPTLPATLWLEQQRDSEARIPLHTRPGDEVVRVHRGDGTRLTSTVKAGLEQRYASVDPGKEWFWLACEASANRELLVHLRAELGVPRSSVAAMAYWKAV